MGGRPILSPSPRLAALPTDPMNVQSIARGVARRATRLIRRLRPTFKGHFDGVFGNVATGWACVSTGRILEVEILLDGVVVATAPANRFRDDVAAAGFSDGHSGFSIALPVRPKDGEVLSVSARIKGQDALMGGSPVAFDGVTGVLSDWLRRRGDVPVAVRDRFRRRSGAAFAGQTLSIVMPVYNTRDDWLRAALQSVVDQWCPAWRLLCIDDGSTLGSVRETLAHYARLDSRIQVIHLDGNVGIAGAVNRGIAEADGEFVAFLDHDDHLEPDAVHRVLKAAKAGADLIYSDEIVVGDDLDTFLAIVLRSAFSYDYYISHPYFVHFVAVRRTLAREVGGWDVGMSISADVDFILRCIERARAVTHIPVPLYRWRTHSGSAGHVTKSKVTEATVGALSRHLERLALPARVTPGPDFNFYRTDFGEGSGRVGIIVPTKDRVDLLRACIDSLERFGAKDQTIIVIDNQSSDPDTLRYLEEIGTRHIVVPYDRPFNFAAMNNHAVRVAAGDCEHLVFMNNDVEAIEAGWIDRMRSLAARPDVGAVGATLIYPDEFVQHAGVIVGFQGSANHSHQHRPLRIRGVRDGGYNGSLLAVRDYSAVTAACMMTRRAVFEAVGGFDEDLVVGFNDTDLCLRIGAAGFKILNDGSTILVHKESATRSESGQVHHPDDTRRFQRKWAEFMEVGDPFYHPGLERDFRDHELARECRGRLTDRTRPVILPRASPDRSAETVRG